MPIATPRPSLRSAGLATRNTTSGGAPPSASVSIPSTTPAAEFFAAYLQGSVNNLDLSAFVWPEDLRPEAAGAAGRVQVPEIDLGPLLRCGGGGQAAAAVASKMSAAAKEWGFFRLVNHGVPPDLMARAERQAQRFFSLPLERKLKAAGSAASPFGYAAAGPSRAVMRSWHETLYLLCQAGKIKELARAVWPSDADNAEFCYALSEYTNAMNKLAQLVLELLLLGLGLDRRCLSRHYSIDASSSARINLYPPCPKPDVTFGLPPHTDSGTLTILHQDSVGGLQVSRSGKWVNVSPVPGSLVVNVGDCLQAWSNGIYRSVEHRALVNSSKPRMSLAFFFNPSDSTVVAPMKELLAATRSTAVYRPFTWAEYRSYAGTHKTKVMNALDHFRVK